MKKKKITRAEVSHVWFVFEVIIVIVNRFGHRMGGWGAVLVLTITLA